MLGWLVAGPCVLLALLVLGACPAPAERLRVPSALPSRSPWEQLELSIGGRPVVLSFAPASAHSSHASSRAVLLLVDDLFRAGEDPTSVVPRDWLTDSNWVIVPLSRLLAAEEGPAESLLPRCAAGIGELGKQLRARGLGERVVLVADGLATTIGARAVSDESTPFDGYVGSSQLTSLAASKVWRGAAADDGASPDPWWWWSLVRPGVEPPRPEDPQGPFLDALAREELRSIDEIEVPMVLLAGRDDPLIPAHHLELWAGIMSNPSIDVIRTRGGYDVLRTAPHEVRNALWSLLLEPRPDPCLARDPPRRCQVLRERWRGPTTSTQGVEATLDRRYDAIEGTLTPKPRTATDEGRALACDPRMDPPGWPTRGEHRVVALDWYPESYQGSSKILEPSALPRLFADMKRGAPPAAEGGGLMVCEVRDRTGGALFGKSNVLAVLRIEDELEIGSVGPNHGRAYIVVPSLRLAPGTAMRVHAKDVNILVDESLGSIELRFDGHWPIEARNDSMTITCRALDRSGVLHRLSTGWGRLTRALARLEETIDGGVDAWPREIHWKAWLELEPVVALLGWADPCTHAWLDRFADARQRWFEERLRVLDERTRETAPQGTWVELSSGALVRVTDAICGSPRRRDLDGEKPEIFCRVDAQLRNTGAGEAALGALLGDDLRPFMELANGETVALVARDEVVPRAGRDDEPESIMDESKVFGSPWRREDRPRRGEPFTRLSRRSLAPGEETHIVWLGRARLRGAEIVLGFRPAILGLGPPQERRRLAL